MNAKGKLITSAVIIVAVIVSSIFYSDSSSLFVESVNDNTQNSVSSQILRIGYFPNINHAQAVIGLGNGTFQKALGDNIEVKTTIFNAGPSAMEALFAKQVDVTYVGPNPAINAYVVSQGKDVRIISGAWVPEPWGARLIKEANARILLDERDLWPPKGQFVTSNIVARTDYLQSNPDVIKKLLTAHVDETEWINSHKEEAITAFNVELSKLTGQAIPEDELYSALSRMELTYDPIKESLFQSANSAFDIGFLGKTRPDLSGIYDLKVLDEVLSEKGLPTIETEGQEQTGIDSVL